MAQSILEYILRSKKEGSGVADVKKELGDLEQQTKKTSDSGGQLGDAWKLAGGAIAAYGVKGVLAATVNLTEQGIAINNAEKALIGYTGSSEEADRAIRAVTMAAGGAITKFEATQNASRLFAMGLASTTDEAAKLTEMAITLGAAMGEDASTSFENFSLMLANQSIPRLDTFGISGAAVRDRMNELTESVAGMDRQTAFLTATMEIGAEAMGKLDEAGFQAVSSLDRLKAVAGDAKDSLAEMVADGLVPMIDQGFRLFDTIKEVNAGIVENTESYDEYIDRVNELKKEQPLLILIWEELSEKEYDNARMTKEVEDRTADLTSGLQELEVGAGTAGVVVGDYKAALDLARGATIEAKDATNDLVFSLGKVTEATVAQKAIEALTVAYGNGSISAEDYEQMTRNIMITLGGYTKAETDAATALAKLESDYASGKISALQFYSQVKQLGDAIRAVPTSHETVFKFRQEGTIPKVGMPPGTDKRYQLGGEFTVAGPAGIDAVPVSFMATAGERVSITPQGSPGSRSGSGLTIDARGAQFFGIGGIADFANHILPYLEDARRNG